MSLPGDNEALIAQLVRHPSTLGQEQSCLAEMEAAYRSIGLSTSAGARPSASTRQPPRVLAATNRL